MGNAESQQPEEEGTRQDTAMRTDYYELLEVERSDSTTTEEIKKVGSNIYFLASEQLLTR